MNRLRTNPLVRAFGMLALRPSRVLAAVLLGTLALGSAVGLSAVSAWLITRAAQMPPVLELSVAAVSVRALGIGRGVFRYVERLVSHDLALGGMAQLRERLYVLIAQAPSTATLSVHRGDLLARVGADVDDVGDLVVRGLLPAGVAAMLGLGTSLVVGAFLPAAGLLLAVCLLVAGVLAPLLARRATRTAEERSARARAQVATITQDVLDDVGELAVSGRLAGQMTALRVADREIIAATDAAARPAALGVALGTLAHGLAVVGALALGVPALASGALNPVELAVVVLTPLAAFEAVSVLPAAAVQVHRSRQAAERIVALVDQAGTLPVAAGAPMLGGPPEVRADALSWGWTPDRPLGTDLDLTLRTGAILAIAGPSGCGKTTLLLTLAGHLDPLEGQVTTRGAGPRTSDVVVHVAEDAHVFGTSVLENLRVARGSVTPDEARGALERLGLGPWLDALPDGVDTLLGPGGQSVSGGERRRLLLARALLSPAPVLLLDEPTEHLDPATADHVTAELVREARSGGPDGAGRAVVLVTHRLDGLEAVDDVIVLHPGLPATRGTHAFHVATDPAYREAVNRVSDPDR